MSSFFVVKPWLVVLETTSKSVDVRKNECRVGEYSGERPVFDKAALLLLPQQVNELLPIMKTKNVLSSTPTRSVKQRAFNSSHWLLKQLAGAGAQRP